LDQLNQFEDRWTLKEIISVKSDGGELDDELGDGETEGGYVRQVRVLICAHRRK
jgi:hypothetical protein